MNRMQASVALAATILTGVFLRAFDLGHRSFWYDEAFAYSLAHEFTWTEMVQGLQQDVHPPFYFVVLRVWIGIFGVSIHSLRGLSVAMAGVTLAGIYLFTRDLLLFVNRCDETEATWGKARAAGVAASALLALFSTHIWLSRETKMYSLATALVIFQAWFLIRALSLDTARKWWTGYAIITALMLYTHNYTIFTFFGECVFLAVFFLYRLGPSPHALLSSTKFRQACAAVFAASCLYLPWLPTLLAQSRRVKVDYWIASATVWDIPRNLDLLYFPGNSFVVPPVRAVIVVIALIALLVWLVSQPRLFNGLLLALVLTPILCALLVSVTFASIITPRYLLFSALFVPTVIVSIIWRTLPRARWGAVFIVLFNLAAIHFKFLGSLHLHDKGAYGAVEHVLLTHEPRHPVIVTHVPVYFTVRYYAEDLLQPTLLLPSEPVPHYLGGPILRQAACISIDELNRCTSDVFWVIDSNGMPAASGIRSHIPTSWQPVAGSRAEFREEFNWQGVVTAQLYRRR